MLLLINRDKDRPFRISDRIKEVMLAKEIDSVKKLNERLEKVLGSEKEKIKPAARYAYNYALLKKGDEIRQKDLRNLSKALKHNFYLDFLLSLYEEMLGENYQTIWNTSLDDDTKNKIREKLEAMRRLDREIESLLDPDVKMDQLLQAKTENIADNKSDDLEKKFLEKHAKLEELIKTGS